MTTTYQDTFTYANGALAGNTGGFGLWSVPAFSTGLTVASHRVTCAIAYPGGVCLAPNPVTAYTFSAEAYFDVFIPTNADDFSFVGIGPDGNSTYFGFFVDANGGTMGGHYWSIAAFEVGYLFDDVDPANMSLGGTCRLGMVHDKLGGTVRAYTEPYGGGTRTWLGAAQATSGAYNFDAWAGVALLLLPGALAGYADGYVDNLTIITANVATHLGISTPASDARSVNDFDEFGVRVRSGLLPTGMQYLGFYPVVAALLDTGDTDTSWGTDVTISIDLPGHIGGTTTVTPVDGVATFTDLTFDAPTGTYTLTFTSGALTVATQSLTIQDVGFYFGGGGGGSGSGLKPGGGEVGPPRLWAATGEHDELARRYIGQGRSLTTGQSETWVYDQASGTLRIDTNSDAQQWVDRTTPTTTWTAR